MNKRLLAIFIFIILMPITVMTVMAVSRFRESRVQSVMEQREKGSAVLLNNARLMQNRLNQIENELMGIDLDSGWTHQMIRNAVKKTGIVKQAFIIDPSNRFIYPDDNLPLSERESEFLKEAHEIELSSALRSGHSSELEQESDSRWYTWFMGDGINFISYRLEEEHIYGFLIERYALISRLINVLPEASESDRAYRISLTDARADVLYQWGGYEVGAGDTAVAEYALTEPLGTWRLHYYINPDIKGETDLSPFAMIPVVALFTILILILALYFYTENTREMRLARKQVSFVSQVSHELKTPLTNIRLYSELLQSRITEPGDSAFLEVIIKESSRLGRMINNVLTFSRGERGELKMNPLETDLNALIEEILQNFIPLLKEQEMVWDFEKGELPVLMTDRDMVEQILVNIIGNSIKYGSSGKFLGIRTELKGTHCRVLIRDRGPGIPASETDNIFKPFYRIDNALSQSSSGTGIGLSIARTLAAASGTVLKLEHTEKGACFSLTIPLKEGTL